VGRIKVVQVSENPLPASPQLPIDSIAFILFVDLQRYQPFDYCPDPWRLKNPRSRKVHEGWLTPSRPLQMQCKVVRAIVTMHICKVILLAEAQLAKARSRNEKCHLQHNLELRRARQEQELATQTLNATESQPIRPQQAHVSQPAPIDPKGKARSSDSRLVHSLIAP
jgi:hypothetical protein